MSQTPLLSSRRDIMILRWIIAILFFIVAIVKKDSTNLFESDYVMVNFLTYLVI